ncbi:MAG: hypothetical protein ACREU7_15855 [Burkholderiales bacterium]
MITITLPAEVEAPLEEEARKQGTTPEMLAVDRLRNRFARQPSVARRDENESLFDFLSGYAGTVSGTSEPLSERSGKRFMEGLLEKQRLRRQ